MSEGLGPVLKSQAATSSQHQRQPARAVTCQSGRPPGCQAHAGPVSTLAPTCRPENQTFFLNPPSNVPIRPPPQGGRPLQTAVSQPLPVQRLTFHSFSPSTDCWHVAHLNLRAPLFQSATFAAQLPARVEFPVLSQSWSLCHPPSLPQRVALPAPEIVPAAPLWSFYLFLTALPPFLPRLSRGDRHSRRPPLPGEPVPRSLEESLVIIVTMPTEKPVLPPLQTPKSASFPSEIVAIASPMAGLPAVLKQEESMKTPITPPVAYTEFLKALTPVITSPAPSSALPSGVPKTEPSDVSSGRNTPISLPSTATSFSSNQSKDMKSPSIAVTPSSPNPRPQSALSPSGLRRLKIPQSPAFSAGISPSPRSAALSALSARSPFSPADWGLDGSGRRFFFEPPRTGCNRPVSVRSVVTRTVTYRRSPPLGPPPKGKRRKISHDNEMPPPPTSPAVAQAAGV